jgi:glycerophosphoryl diester phosphodiesterase
MAKAFDLNAFFYAHRGLWTKDAVPENSLASFVAAAEAGLGIEFDVRPSEEGEIMIFHDPVIERMTALRGLVEQYRTSVLHTLTLGDTDEHIPTLDDLLAMWPERLPLLCEMKIDGTTDPDRFARKVGARLAKWDGIAAAMSFSEDAVRALPKGLMRGQLVYPAGPVGGDRTDAIVERALADGIDYLAVHYSDVSRVAELVGGRDVPVVVWTVRSDADLAAVRPYKAAIIFEHIDPAHLTP